MPESHQGIMGGIVCHYVYRSLSFIFHIEHQIIAVEKRWSVWSYLLAASREHTMSDIRISKHLHTLVHQVYSVSAFHFIPQKAIIVYRVFFIWPRVAGLSLIGILEATFEA